MAGITLDAAERAALEARLRDYLSAKLDCEIGGLQAALLLDVIAETIGPALYNQGVLDAKALIAHRMDDVLESVHGLEKG